MDSFIIIFAYVLDLLIGDPRRFPHPVRAIGRLISGFESVLRRFTKTPGAGKTAGVVLVILVVSLVYFTSQFLILSAIRLSTYFGLALSILMAYTTLAARGLGDAAKAVLMRLEAGDIDAARKELSMIVGRDTANLDEQEITRAVVETVAENASDGVIAPLLYLAIGGPALAMTYKAVNTMDSMLGYKNEKYINFGWAAARLDDAVNFIPARITGVLICLAAYIYRPLMTVADIGLANTPSPQPSPPRGEGDSALRTPHSAFMSPWRIMFRDHAHHPSPNCGWPEAAMAGALGVRLGGPSVYFGSLSQKPYIGDPLYRMDKNFIAKAVRLMYCSALFAVVFSALGAAAVKFH